MYKKNKSKYYIYFLCFYIYIVLTFCAMLWYYEHRFFHRAIRTPNIINLEKELKDEFYIKKFSVITSRGWHCYFYIDIDKEYNVSTYDEIFEKVQFVINQGLGIEILRYAGINFSEPHIPREDRFYLWIRVNNEFVYNKKLNINQ